MRQTRNRSVETAYKLLVPTRRRLLTTVLSLLLLTALVGVAETVGGHINITRRLTKPSLQPVSTAYARGVLVSPDRSEQDVVAGELDRIAIYIESEQPLSAKPVTEVIEQRGRRFTTPTVVIPQGSEVSFPNFDPIFHNVFSLSKARSFDLGNYRKGQTRVVTFPTPGFVKVYCHLHPNMRAVVVITPNDRATKPDSAGDFQIADVPPGEHALVVWHPSAGFFRRTLVVADGANTSVNFDIPVEVGDAARH